jgi:hypothetical protein
MKEITYKNNHGVIEVYGRTSKVEDPGYAHEDATRIGLHVTDYSIGYLRSAAMTMTPAMARKVAEKLLQWSDAIESREN